MILNEAFGTTEDPITDVLVGTGTPAADLILV